MNLKNLTPLLMAGLMAAALGFSSTGCNENTVNPNDTTNNGTGPGAPTNVMAVSKTSTSVGLVWTAPADTGVLTYKVEASAIGAATDTVLVTGITGTSTTVTGLNAGTAYAFKVYAIRSGVSSVAGQVIWAGATRYNAGGMDMQIYEFASVNGSGLILDPAKGGPANISLTSPSTNVQLVMYNNDRDTVGGTTLRIGSAYGIEEYKNVNGFDQNTYVSDSIYAVPDLDAWYETQPLTARFSSGTGNLKSFLINERVTGSNTYMFYVRTGTAGNYHYARVLVKKDASGNILRGTSPNRYVELEISYQLTPDLPYAKIPAGAKTPIGVIPATFPN